MDSNRPARLKALRDSQYMVDLTYKNLFNTPDGKLVLEDLNRHFNPENLATENPHTTAVRVGESTPIRYIERRIKDGMAAKSA